MQIKKNYFIARLLLGAFVMPILAKDQVADYFTATLTGKEAKFDGKPLELAKIDEKRKELFVSYSAVVKKVHANKFKAPDHLQADVKNQIAPGEYHIGEKLDMPYLVFSRGEKPAGGWPLVIAMHGGGGTSDKLPNPHAWPVNDGEFRAQATLSATRYPDGAIYFVPRMVDDNNGRWWRDFNIEGFEAMIRYALVNWEVNPDRVYMLGISEGGYGTEVLATRMTDRFAAVSAMACGSGSSIHVENLRNLFYRTEVGEKDTAFGRVMNARENHRRLEELRGKDAQGYVNVLNEQKGRGHGIDYTQGPAWMITHTRKTHPERVVLTTYRADKKRNDSAYWLQITKDLGERDVYLDAKIDKTKNAIDIKAEATKGDATYQSPDWQKALSDPGPLVPATGLTLRIWLHESLIDFAKPLTVRINGKEVKHAEVTANLKAMVESLQRSGDPQRIYPACLDVTVPSDAP